MRAEKMKIIEQKNREAELILQLVAIWQRSVRTTHQFLTETAIATIASQVPLALTDVERLVILSDEEGQPLGFMGVQDKTLEMLFLDPTAQGQGWGRRLVTTAIQTYGVMEVAVNEQNPKARGFYEALGFVVYKRKETDDQGNPYPLLLMNYEA